MSDSAQTTDGYTRFREAMQDGRLQPGMIVTQHELCALLGLSLSPLRETLVLLEEFGLVEIRPRMGIRIVYPEVAFIRENYQFRIMIEVYALRSFGGNVTEDWLANMRASHEDCRTQLTNDTLERAQERFVRLDGRLHREIVEALDNKAVLATHQRLQANIQMAQLVHRRPGFRGALLQTIDEHLAIIDALEARDVDAAVAALEAHFRGATHRTFAG
ncbi:MAG: GntR family transcriptional regulator [Alphaproteobacteria bacterium]|nr:GntR family transcriptional regulator [Alphaproteobacteria bacterium]